MKIYISGKFYEEQDAKISVFDHGLLYGDGVFEGIRLYENCVFRLEEHLDRLLLSAKAILLNLPWDKEFIAQAILESCRINKLKNGYIRLVITRGKGSLGLSHKLCKTPELIIIADTITIFPEEFYQKGIRLATVPTRRSSRAGLPPTIKSLNYLNNVMAKAEAQMFGFDEGLLLDEAGFVTEASAENIFIISEGILKTPPSSFGALDGVTRKVVLEIAHEQGIKTEIIPLTRYDLWAADECFLSGTGAEIVPVIEIDGRSIANGTPGAMMQKIFKHFKQKTHHEGRFL